MLPIKLRENTKNTFIVLYFVVAVVIIAISIIWTVKWMNRIGDNLGKPASQPVTQEQVDNIEERLGKVERAQQEVSRGGQRTRAVMMEATAYTWTGNTTSTGTWPVEGRTVGVDPTVIPYNSKLIINGRGGYIAEDSGDLVKGHKIDIYLSDYNECLSFGRRNVNVIIEEP